MLRNFDVHFHCPVARACQLHLYASGYFQLCSILFPSFCDLSLSLSFVNYTLSGRIPGICLNHLEFVSSFFHSSALQRYSCGESCGEVQCLCERSLMRSIETLAPSKPSANLKILAGLPRCKHLFCLHLTIYSQG